MILPSEMSRMKQKEPQGDALRFFEIYSGHRKTPPMC